ncbi:MAG: hypothetical protein DWQ19_11140 [Crenarchaeota archaeon]|nr:MAG: hypothetical protein DWQ19_11140 [Thermoproteota archaeon]
MANYWLSKNKIVNTPEATENLYEIFWAAASGNNGAIEIGWPVEESADPVYMSVSYDVWYEELCKYAGTYGWEEYVRSDKEAWRLSYEDNMTPEEAFLEDASYWEEG